MAGESRLPASSVRAVVLPLNFRCSKTERRSGHKADFNYRRRYQHRQIGARLSATERVPAGDRPRWGERLENGSLGQYDVIVLDAAQERRPGAHQRSTEKAGDLGAGRFR